MRNMRKIILLSLFFLFFSSLPAYPQQGNAVIINFPGAPAGSCSPISLGKNSANGDLYTCVAGSWVLVGVAGGGATPGGMDTQVQFNDMGAFAGDSDFTFVTDTVTATNLVVPTNLDLNTAGVRLSGADGVLTMLGLGNGNDENLTLDFDNGDTNQVVLGTGTGVTNIRMSGSSGLGFSFASGMLLADESSTYITMWDNAAKSNVLFRFQANGAFTLAQLGSFSDVIPVCKSSGHVVSSCTSGRVFAGGTDHVSGDYALHANWGDMASVAVESDSKDQAFKITVTSAGTGQGLNPTIVLTYKDGTFTQVPKCLANQQGGTGARADVDVSTTATALTLTWLAIPVDTMTYEFAGHCRGVSN